MDRCYVWLFVAGLIGGAWWYARPAEADYFTGFADACYPMDFAAASWGTNSSGNMYHATTTTNRRVVCNIHQIGVSGDDGDDDVEIEYYDTNGTGSSGDQYNVYCDGFTYPPADQSSFYSVARRWGCTTTGGCSSSPTISFADQGRITLADFDVGYGIGARVISVVCSLPRWTGAGSTSSLNSLRFNRD